MKISLSVNQFKQCFAESKSLHVGDLLFKYKRDDAPKLGLVVSRKYGNAVKRNLFKRRCRSLFQSLANSNFSYSIIIMPKKTNITWRHLSLAFSKLITKLDD